LRGLFILHSRPGAPALLVALLALLTGVDMLWVALGHFALDGGGYFRLGLLAACLFGGACFYQRARPDPRLAAMLFGTGFLCAFSMGASILNYLLLSCAGARIDLQLAALDRAMGFDWPRVMTWMARHPRLNAAALLAYSSMLPQVALLTIALATVEPARVYRFCLALALSALACIAIWTMAPSFGAFSVYPLAIPHMALALDQGYARELVRLLKDGPGLISPDSTRGLIGFPSYHAVLALLVMWHARDLKFLRFGAIGLNVMVLAATPVQGGHHLIDVLGAFPVAALALFAARARNLSRVAAKHAGMVNKRPKFTIRPVLKGLFRIMPTHTAVPPRDTIKSKLSRVP
jgi:hypothetical protein